MLIPSIDLMSGKIVQLVQGERKILEFDDFPEWIHRFRKFPVVQLIDLDAAMGRDSNRQLVAKFCAELPCQVGGGLRTLDGVQEILALGARKVIVGSSLFSASGINLAFARALADEVEIEKLIFAVDSRSGFISVKGWKESTTLHAPDAIRALEPFCSAFLYTHIDTEGLMQGFPIAVAEALRTATKKKLIVAGGITTPSEIERLEGMGIDAVVGMAIYTGALQV